MARDLISIEVGFSPDELVRIFREAEQHGVTVWHLIHSRVLQEELLEVEDVEDQ